MISFYLAPLTKWTQLSFHRPCFQSEHRSGQEEVEPQLETAEQELVQSVLLPWEQAFYPAALETVFALRQRRKRKNAHLIRSHHSITVVCI